MRRRYIVLALLTVVVVTVAYAYASPYLTISRIRQAAARGDAETVNVHVDFPALRESVKGWMGVAMAKEMSKQDSGTTHSGRSGPRWP